MLDNYDSFTYNLVYIVRNLGYEIDVFRNDKIALEDVAQYDKIILSPGPGLPKDAGIMFDVIRKYAPEKSILGICLGHQGIAEVFGCQLRNLEIVKHGFASDCQLEKDCKLFESIPTQIKVGHYHSWVVDKAHISDDITITATSEEGLIMGLKHKNYNVYGLQFHPESVLTEYGTNMIENWLKQ